jgi:DNA topoisomerase-1
MLVAKKAELRYVNDSQSGIRRTRKGNGFAYHRPDGSLIKDRQELHRTGLPIVIQPATNFTVICSHPEAIEFVAESDASVCLVSTLLI